MDAQEEMKRKLMLAAGHAKKHSDGHLPEVHDCGPIMFW